MTDYAERIRSALEPQGLLPLLDVLADVEARLARLDGRARATLAALCAMRLMSLHRQLPPESQRPFTLSWATHLDAIWEALRAEAPNDALTRVRAALAEFRGGPFNQENGPDDADDDAAAAAIYAVEAVCEPGGKAALWAISRLTDWSFVRVETLLYGDQPRGASVEDDIAVYAHPVVQDELRRIIRGLAAIESSGTKPNVLLGVRQAFDAA